MLITGDKLNFNTRQDVLRCFVYRPTIENGYPKRNPLKMRVEPITDEQWLKEHAFHVKADGSLDNRYNHCEPAFMAEGE